MSWSQNNQDRRKGAALFISVTLMPHMIPDAFYGSATHVLRDAETLHEQSEWLVPGIFTIQGREVHYRRQSRPRARLIMCPPGPSCQRRPVLQLYISFSTPYFHLHEVIQSLPLRMAFMAVFKPPSTRPGVLRHRSMLFRRNSKSTARSDPPNDDGEDIDHSSIRPSKHTPRALQIFRGSIAAGGPLRPLRLVREDLQNLRRRYLSDWTLFNQLVFASAVYVFFTNLLPGITFASDLYVLTGQNWGTIEVVFSTGLCGLIFSLSVFPFHANVPLRFLVNFR